MAFEFKVPKASWNTVNFAIQLTRIYLLIATHLKLKSYRNVICYKSEAANPIVEIQDC